MIVYLDAARRSQHVCRCPQSGRLACETGLVSAEDERTLRLSGGQAGANAPPLAGRHRLAGEVRRLKRLGAPMLRLLGREAPERERGRPRRSPWPFPSPLVRRPVFSGAEVRRGWRLTPPFVLASSQCGRMRSTASRRPSPGPGLLGRPPGVPCECILRERSSARRCRLDSARSRLRPISSVRVPRSGTIAFMLPRPRVARSL